MDAPIDIDPGCRSEALVIPFRVDLSTLSMTNYVRIKIEYTTRDGRRLAATFYHPHTDFIIPLPVDPAPKSQLFIGHKIPLDMRLAKRLSHYLSKVGIRGCLVEDDPRYGHHMHTGKFSPEIDASKAVVVLWTEGASADPGTMSWEIKYAMEREKRLIVVKEGTADAPCDVPPI